MKGLEDGCTRHMCLNGGFVWEETWDLGWHCRVMPDSRMPNEEALRDFVCL